MKNDIQTKTLAKPSCPVSVGFLLNTAAMQIKNLLKQALEPIGVTPEQFVILMSLFDNDDITQTTIAKRVALPDYTITRQLDVLEEKGLLQRHADAGSRRSYRIRVTEEGRTLQPQLLAIVQQANQAFLQGMSEQEVKDLKMLLTKLVSE